MTGILKPLADAINDGELGRERTARIPDDLVEPPHHRHAADAVLVRFGGGARADARGRIDHHVIDRLQRRNEIGLRRALGATTRSVVAEFAAESALYGMAGGLCGVGLGYALAHALCRMVFDRTLDFSVALGSASVVLSVAVAVAASTPPIRNATRIDPAVVLREE